jgi:23S rRNA (uridine2552-2'-O)-methyltransferase
MTEKKNSGGASQKGHRQIHTKVKTARGRKNSSTRWLQRQLNDPYVQMAQKDGYRSRAAYKLIEIDDKFQILRSGKNIVDLGSAPGGWTQVCVQRVKGSKVIGIDLQKVDPIEGSIQIQEDFTEEAGLNKLNEALKGKKVDIILSDMAAASCGHSLTDHVRIISLCETAFDFAKENLNIGGVFVAKILRGGTEKELLDDMKKHFKTVKHFKPESSRKDSSEMYVVAIDFRI